MWSTADEGAVRALEWFLANGAPRPLPQPVLFLGARAGAWSTDPATAAWRLEQPFAPYARAMARDGREVSPHLDGKGFATTLLLPARQREHARCQLARALRATADGGLLIVAAGNNDGARTLEADLRALAGEVQSLSKHRSRVLSLRVDATRTDARRADEWLALDAIRQVDAGGGVFWSRPGLFAWDHIDPASARLAAELPATLSGRVADLGSGWGYLAMQVLARCPGVTAIDLYEADARALEPAWRNLETFRQDGMKATWSVHWHDVSEGLPGRYDVVVSNPPFHIGRADAPQLGQAFIDAAADALLPHGQAWFVANRHLPYETLLARRFRQVAMPLQRDGYKVLHACHPRR